MKTFCAVLMFVIIALQPARADVRINEVVLFDDSHFGAIAIDASSRWSPGHDGGVCNSMGPTPLGLCGPGTGSDGSVWGQLAPPSSGAFIVTDVAEYGGLTPLSFNKHLWVKEWDLPEGSFGNYLYNELWNPETPLWDDPNALFLQFNSAVAGGFGCLPGLNCSNTILEDGMMTAGYVKWSDGSFDKIMFYGEPIPVPEPETYAMLLAGLGLLGFIAKRRKTQSA